VIDYVTVASRWVRTFEGAPDQVAALRVQWEGDTVEIPVIYGITSLAADSFTILWISDPENSYAVYRSTNLMFNFPGDLLTNGFAGDPIGTNVYTDTNAVPPAAFYSIGIDNP